MKQLELRPLIKKYGSSTFKKSEIFVQTGRLEVKDDRHHPQQMRKEHFFLGANPTL